LLGRKNGGGEGGAIARKFSGGRLMGRREILF